VTDLLVAGEVTVDVHLPGDPPGPDEKVVVQPTATFPGGVGANTAVAAARAGATVSLVAGVGDDAAGRTAVEGLRAAGVGVAHVAVQADASTLRCLLWRGEGGTRRSLLVAGPLVFPSPAAVAAAVEEAPGWLHVAPFEREGVLAGLAAARRCGVPTSMDLEPAGVQVLGSWLPSALAGLALLVCGRGVAAGLTGCASHVPASVLTERVAALGPAAVVVTDGAAGAWLSIGRQAVHVPAPPVDAIDGTGAGDCFAGTLLACHLRGASLPEAARRATVAAAVSTTVLGAQTTPA
jgi:ribokinase